MKNFRERLTEWRDRHGLSRDKAGRLLGVTGHYVGMIERGDKEVADESTLDRLLTSYERDGMHTDNILRDTSSARYSPGRKNHSAAMEDDSFSVPVSRVTFERLTTFARERDLPSGDIADIAIMQYIAKLDAGRKKH
jgi:transcriptional regulator with XRE-family HTH domain